MLYTSRQRAAIIRKPSRTNFQRRCKEAGMCGFISKPADPHAIESVLSNIGLNDMEKAVRLDILGTNTAAERLYTRCGFRFVQAKQMYYDDTGWTEYKYN